MILTASAQAAITLANQLEANGKRVVLQPGSPLKAILDLSCSPLKAAVDPTAAPAEYVPDAQAIEFESRIEALGEANMSQHDVAMDDLISDLSAVVGQHLTFARNTVRPAVKAFVDGVTTILAGIPEQATYSPTVVKVDLPAVALMSQLTSEYKSYKDVAYRDMTTALRLPVLPASEVLQLLKTGSAAVDAAVDLWVESVGEGFFVNAYQLCFCSSAEGVAQTPDAAMNDLVQGPAATTAMYMIARGLLDNPPAGSEYGLTEYRTAVGEVLEQLGVRMCLQLEKRERLTNLQALVISYDKDMVFVSAPVFDRWIEDGGNVTALYGSMLLNMVNPTIAGLSESAAQCIQVWERENLILTTTQRNRRNDILREAMRGTVRKVVAEHLDDFYGQWLPGRELSLETREIAELIESADAVIAFTDVDKLSDLWAMGTQVVAGSLFSFSSAYDILKGIDDAAKQNPGIDPAEAALLSTVAMVCRFISDNLQLENL